MDNLLGGTPNTDHIIKALFINIVLDSSEMHNQQVLSSSCSVVADKAYFGLLVVATYYVRVTWQKWDERMEKGWLKTKCSKDQKK